MKKRILQIIANGDPGGGTTHVLQLIRSQSSEYEIGLISQSYSYIFSQTSGAIFQKGISFSSLLQIAEFKKVILEFNPDMIHLHGGRATFFYALTGLKIPSVYTIHGYHFVQKNPLLKWLFILAEHLSNRSADKVIFVCQYDQKLAQQHRFKFRSSEVIYNGIPNLPKRSSHEAQKHIGFIGRLVYQKNPQFFIEVVKKLSDHRVTIVGGGPFYEELDTTIKLQKLAHITLVGDKSHQEALDIMKQLDILVMPSRWEGFPILLLEAMALGVPIIANNVGGISEMIKSPEEGFLLNDFSIKAYQEKIKILSDNPKLQSDMANKARTRFEVNFTEDTMFNKIRKAYQGLLES